MRTLLHDTRLVLRQLRSRPAFTTVAVLTLAIGVGVNTVAFAVVNGLLIKAFGGRTVEGVGRIVTSTDEENGNASMPEYERFADAARGALDLAAEGRSSVAWRHDGITETAWVLFISSNYFSLVNAPVMAGQLEVRPAGDGQPSVVIGERFWRRTLGSPSLSGLTLVLNNVDVAVAGVIPDSFTGPAGIYSPDVWLPLEDLTRFGRSDLLRRRDARWLFVMGRLNDGTTAAQAQAIVSAADAQMATDWSEPRTDRHVRFKMLGERSGELRGVTIGATIGMAIVGLVLLLACFNVANLLLARAVERERDMGIRAALGASRGRMMRLVMTEGVVIAVTSGALALVLASWTQALVGSFAIPIDEPQHIDLSPDRTLVGFVAVLVLLAGVLPGLWPAVVAARVDVARVLGSQGMSTGGRPSPLRRWLIGAQIAGSTVFVCLAALLTQSYDRVSSLDVGFARDHLLMADLDPAANGYGPDRAARYVEALRARVSALPGVADVAVADRAPFFIGYDRDLIVWPANGTCEANTCPSYPVYAVSTGYFRTMGIPLAAGRELEERSASQVIVNQAFARSVWPNGDALGATMRVGAAGRPVTVVGVAGRTRIRDVDRERPALFVPIAPEQLTGAVTLVVRTTGIPASLVRPVADAANLVDPNVALHSVKTMEERMAVQLWPFRTLSRTFSICGLLAIGLAVVGLVSVVMHGISRRTRELGVRASLGATPTDLLLDVLRDSAALLSPGLVVGVLVAAGIAQLARTFFLGLNVLNPLVYLGVAAAHAVVVVLACLRPALRAARIDPLTALRAE